MKDDKKDPVTVLRFFGNTEIFLCFESYGYHKVCITNIIRQLKIRKDELATHRDDPLLDLCYIFPFRDQRMRWLELPFLNGLLFRIKHWNYPSYQSELIQFFQRYLYQFLHEAIYDPSSMGIWMSNIDAWTKSAQSSTDYKEFLKLNTNYEKTESATFEKTVSPKGVDEGHVYVLQMGNHFKIGKSKRVDSRIREFSPKLPLPVTVVTTFLCKNYSQAESNLHLKFADKRTNGEWFALEQEDIEWLLGKRGPVDF